MSLGRYSHHPSPPGIQGDIAIHQEYAQPLTRIRLRPGVIRYMYDRAQDSKVNGEPGEDFLACRYTSGQLAFAVCDGVSASFLGNFAAQFLGVHLVQWLWAQPASMTRDWLQDGLTRYLHDLVEPASQLVGNYPLPGNVPVVVRELLEKQRAYGSEAMFVCGRIAWSSQRGPGQVALAWLGDAELQVYNKGGRRQTLRGTVAERWSTSRGPRGELHALVEAADGIARVIGYSDGLHGLADDLFRLPDNVLGQELARLGEQPHSDDLSLVDIALDEQYMPAEHDAEERIPPPKQPPTWPEHRTVPQPPVGAAPSTDLSLVAPCIVSAAPGRDGSVLLCWTPVRNIDKYRVQLAATPAGFEQSPLAYIVPETTFTTAPLMGQTRYARVQALTGERSGSWSEIVKLDDLAVARPPAPASRHPASHPPPGKPPLATAPMSSPSFIAPPSNARINTSFTLSWTEVPNADGYLFQKATDPGFDRDDAWYKDVYRPYLMIEEKEASVYYYRVRARISNRWSAWSSPLRVQIHHAEPGTLPPR